jgi:phytoene dehydrogenase-like protein
LMEFMRILPMPVADFLDEWFENPVYKGVLGSLAVRGTMAGPRSPGTSLLFLFGVQGAAVKQSRGSRFVRGGMLQLAQALAAAAVEHGAEIRTGCRVAQVCIKDGRATGVLLENGEEIGARVVVSNASPRHTFLDLVGPEQLEVRFVREVKQIRYRGSLARLVLALDALPHFRAAASREVLVKEGTLLSGHTILCPDLDFLERAYDAAKYGRFSENLVLDIFFPTMLDASLAPPGKHLLLANVQYAPYHLSDGDWDTNKEGFSRRVIDLLEEYAPGIQNLILHQELLTPLDLERRFGLPEGCIYHGQMALDQLLVMRPVPGYSRYRSPIQGLYLCGAGTHPGGGVTGAPGHNAAREIGHDLRANRSSLSLTRRE